VLTLTPALVPVLPLVWKLEMDGEIGAVMQWR